MKPPFCLMANAGACSGKVGTPKMVGASIIRALALDNLCHEFSEARVLDDVGLTAKSGTIIVT